MLYSTPQVILPTTFLITYQKLRDYESRLIRIPIINVNKNGQPEIEGNKGQSNQVDSQIRSNHIDQREVDLYHVKLCPCDQYTTVAKPVYTEVEFHGIARLDIANNHLASVRLRQIDGPCQETTVFTKNMSISLELLDEGVRA